MNINKWSPFSNQTFFGTKFGENPGPFVRNNDSFHRNFWDTPLPANCDGYGSSTSDGTDNYAASFSGSDVTSKKSSEPSAWSLISAASTSSSFYPTNPPRSSPKPYRESTPIRNRVQQQQEISINLGKENEDDSDTERAPTVDSSSFFREIPLKKSEPTSVEKAHSLPEEIYLRVNSAKDVEGKDARILKLLGRVAELEAHSEEQRIAIANLKDEIDSQRSTILNGDTKRESLLVKNASLSHQLEYEKREWSIEREQLAMQLEDVTRELELQKMLLNSESISEIVQRWQNKVFDLQGMIYDRDRAIRSQQQRISELMKNPHGVATDMMPSTFTNVKRAVMQLLTNRYQRNAEQSFSALASVLHFTNEEETAIRKSLNLY